MQAINTLVTVYMSLITIIVLKNMCTVLKNCELSTLPSKQEKSQNITKEQKGIERGKEKLKIKYHIRMKHKCNQRRKKSDPCWILRLKIVDHTLVKQTQHFPSSNTFRPCCNMLYPNQCNMFEQDGLCHIVFGVPENIPTPSTEGCLI